MVFYSRNRILNNLPLDVQASIWPHLTHAKLRAGETLYEAGSPIRRIYFISEGVAAYVKMMSDGRSTIVGTIGIEGMTGHTVALGRSEMCSDCVMHIAGTALAIDADVLCRLSQKHAPLRSIMQNFAHYMGDHIAQIAACNRLHNLEQRCARILMTNSDSAGPGEFRLTQESLAMALGGQRPHVSVVASRFQRHSLIQYRHGHVQVTDPEGLRAASCECYQVIRDQIDLLFDHEVAFVPSCLSA